MGQCRLSRPSERICTLSICTVSAWIMNTDRGNACRLQWVFSGARSSPVLGPVFLFHTFVFCFFLSSPLLSFQRPTSCSPTLMCSTCTQLSLPSLCIYGAFCCTLEVSIYIPLHSLWKKNSWTLAANGWSLRPSRATTAANLTLKGTLKSLLLLLVSSRGVWIVTHQASLTRGEWRISSIINSNHLSPTIIKSKMTNSATQSRIHSKLVAH